jgi:MFS family permease
MAGQSDRTRLFAAGFLRATGVGLTGVLLGLYLAETGVGAARLGLIVSLGLAGGALATLFVGLVADSLGRKRTFLVLSGLAIAGGAAIAAGAAGGALLLACTIGMINGMGRDRGAASTLEQAILPATAEARQRTRLLSWYHLTLDAGHATGSLLAGLPLLLRAWMGWDLVTSYRWTFAVYAALGVAGALFYAGLSNAIESDSPRTGQLALPRPSSGVRALVVRFASLSLLDSLGGGFLTAALISYWFFRRFGAGEEVLAPVFFAARVLNGISYLLAEGLARRIGLLNTMVFTHLPSSFFLLAVPFAPTLSIAIALFLAREILVEMDVPTRQSYLLAVVSPAERTFAASMVALTRNTAWAVAPVVAGWAMTTLAISAGLVAGAALKIIYDLSLFAAFRRLKPPEEKEEREAGACTEERA